MTGVLVVVAIGFVASYCFFNAVRAEGNIPIRPWHYAMFYIGVFLGLIFGVLLELVAP